MKITQEMVNEALDRAFENGYDHTLDDPEQVAVELCDLDSDFEEIALEQRSEDLIPYVKEWQRQRGLS